MPPTMQTPTLQLSHIVRGHGPGLLLAHGGGGSVRNNLGSLINPLAKHFTVVGPDYPGSGTTPRSKKSLQLDTLADQMVATAVQAGLETFAILGYSLGSAVAIRATTRHPERITALILTAGFAHLDTAARLRAEVLRTLAEREEWKVLGRLLVGSLISEQFLKALSQEQVEELVEQAALGLPAGFAEQTDLVMRVDVSQDLPHISVPTLIINMTDERLVSRQGSKALTDNIVGAKVAELDSGHMPLDCGPAWLELAQDFFATVPALAESRQHTEPLTEDWQSLSESLRVIEQASQSQIKSTVSQHVA